MGKDAFVEQEKEMSARSYVGNELKYVKQVLKSGMLSGLTGGEFTPRFEAAFAKAIGTKHAVAMNSCMSALHAALLASGVEAGDEVICDSEFVFGAMAVLYCNAIPMFIDINPITHNMDPDCIEPAITEKTKAIIVTHAWGLPAEMDRIVEIGHRHGLKVIEDCAESILATYKGRCTGGWGDAGCFSFQASKQLSLGDGGMATMNDEEMFKGIGRHGGAPTSHSVAMGLDYNYRITEPMAAIGLAQVEVLEETIQKLKTNAKYYDQAVEGCDWIRLQRGPADADHSFYHWAATFTGDDQGISLDDFKKAVESSGTISLTVGYTGRAAYEHPLIKDRMAHSFHCAGIDNTKERYPKGLCPNAEHVVPRIMIGYLVETEDMAKQEADILHQVILRIEKR